MARTGFYASQPAENDVFAYSVADHDAVWLRIGTLDLTGEDPEEAWPLPEKPGEMDAWLKKYNFKQITTARAGQAVSMYLYRVIAMLNPENNAELLRDPKLCVSFVREVQAFIYEVGELG